MELKKLDFLFVVKGVESAGFETRESVVGRGQDGQCIVGVVELNFDLVYDLGVLEKADENVEPAGLFEDVGDIRDCR